MLLLLSQIGCEQQQLATSSHTTVQPQTAAPQLKQQLPQQLYIWQRVWTAEHQQTLEQSRPHFSALRVLALQYMATAQGPLWHQADVNMALLKKDGRPVTLVLRLDGQIPKLPQQSLMHKIKPILALYQQAGIALAGIEIDYDCARSQLAAYRLWLTNLRAELSKERPKALPLGITALPDWLQSAEFGPLTAQVSQVTMQLHAVLSPQQGLFAPKLAKKWAIAAAAKSQSPLYFALPAYHSALISPAPDHKTTQPANAAPQYWVESEVPLDIQGERRELWVEPAMMQQWLVWLYQQQFANLKGIVWFRLPLPSDQRSWAYRTLAAVATQQPLKANLQLRLQKTPAGFDLIAENHGNLALFFVTPIRLKANNCAGADALAGFTLSQQQQEYQLEPTAAAQPLAVNSTRTLAWFNCQNLQLHTET